MRIAVVHSFYTDSTPSGENLSVIREVEALTALGHEVELVARYTDILAKDVLYRLKSAVRVATGNGGDPSEELRRFAPDVTHVHNLFPNLGTRWLMDWTGPIVTTLHNFRPLCANGLLYRDGGVCTLCPDHSSKNSLRHACYRNSRLASLPLSLATARPLARNPLLRRSDRVILLSERSRAIYEHYGLEAGKSRVIYNGLQAPAIAFRPPSRDGRWIAVGRLTPEKGFLDLARVWPDGWPLDVIGDGPESGEIVKLGRKSVSMRPKIDNKELLSRLPNYTGLVLPSRCYENLPTVALEALASGTPVVALDGNAFADLLLTSRPSWVYNGSSASLELAISSVHSEGEEARQWALKQYTDEFSLPVWTSRLQNLFEEVQSATSQS